MSFEQFLQTYDMVDFAWEIFKGISPTIIALLTIWINTIIGRRKTEKEFRFIFLPEISVIDFQVLFFWFVIAELSLG